MSQESPKYRSKLERTFAAYLGKKKVPFKYEAEKLTYYISVRGGMCGSCGATKGVLKKRYYVPDFKVGAIYLETKGRLTSAERTKFIALDEAYPNKVVLVFQRDNYIRKGSKTKYSDWCKEYGIKYNIGTDLKPSLLEEVKREAKRAKDSAS